jgi:alpha-glucosidase
MTDLLWWQKAVFYQIYPRSFADGNGDGVGDFIGMAQRLDYLQDLGVDALWLSPHFPSPQFDVGYDVSDFTGVAPEYGTLDDFKRFLDGAHQRGTRVILDLVLNHTSHLHAWFVESRASRDNPKRDWYIWHPGRDGGPPNNWHSLFGGSAWELDPATGEYYYHMFLKEQPDLNWRNPAVKAAMWDAVRFWLDLGVDGYRLDAIGTVFENPGLPDQRSGFTDIELQRAFRAAQPHPPSPELIEARELMFAEQVEQPGVHELMQELRAVVDEYPERVLVGESDDIRYYGDGTNELHLAFNFPLMRTERLTPAWIRANQQERLAALPPGAWPCNTLGNHDTSRLHSRYGDGQHDAALARLSLALMLTLPGTPFLYNGEEIGMVDYHLTDLDLFRDPPAVWQYQAELARGTPPEAALALAARHSRDRCRTPLQWANAANAGFSPPGVQTWLPPNPDYAPAPAGRGVNVADQAADPDSLLNFYKQLLRLRRQTPALIAGGYEPLNTDAEDYLAFVRSGTGDHPACLVVLNYSAQAVTVALALPALTARCLFSTTAHHGAQQDLQALTIAPFGIYLGALAA